MQIELPKKVKLIWQDALIIAGLVMNVLAKFTAIAITTTLQNYSSNTKAIEANPFQSLFVSTNYLISFLGFVIPLSFFIAYYIWIRRYRKHGKYNLLLFDMFTICVFIFFLFDLNNDLAILVGLWLH